MRYEEALLYVKNLPNCGFRRYGLNGIRAILELLGNPQEKLRYIHIAGTNGKGSVASFCAKSLEVSGFKTGLYISPYVLDFRERIQINGSFIKKAELCFLVEELKIYVENLNKKGIFLTGFDFITALAFKYFFENRCEFVVLEVGMGGALDSTNVISRSDVAVINHIDYDHVKELSLNSCSVLDIAKEKAGIIKENGTCVFSRNQYKDVMDFFKREAKRKGASFSIPEKATEVFCSCSGNSFKFKGNFFTTKLFGLHQIENAISSIEALLKIGIKIEYIKKGLKEAYIPARMEIINKSPMVVLDGAHNEDAFICLKNNLKFFSNNLKIAVISIIKTKDYRKMLEAIDGVFDFVVFTKMKDERGVESAVLGEIAKEIDMKFFVEGNLEKALLFSMDFAKKNNATVFVFGSLYFASEVLKFLG